MQACGQQLTTRVVLSILLFVLIAAPAAWPDSLRDQQRENASTAKSPNGSQARMSTAEGRSFYLGFTPMQYDVSAEADAEIYRFIEQNADLVAHHFDEGVPWPEALVHQPYHPAVEKNLKARVQHLSRSQKVYVAAGRLTAPDHDDLIGYWAEESNTPRPGKWKNKSLDDPEVITAYTNFCLDLIDRFHPDFMAYGIEVNYLVRFHNQWPRLVAFFRQVYSRLKARNPHLPLFLTLQIDEFWKNEKEQRKAVRQVLPYTDYIAISSYPYVYGYFDPATIPKDYISGMTELDPDKPFVVAETGFIAKDVKASGIGGPGREDWQNAYMNFLLGESARLNAKMVVWFEARDLDLFIEHLKTLGAGPEVTEAFGLFRNMGLVESSGRKRSALETWLNWLRKPVSLP